MFVRFVCFYLHGRALFKKPKRVSTKRAKKDEEGVMLSTVTVRK